MGKRKTNAGKIINPPPIPNKPAKKPMNKPRIRQLIKNAII